MSKIFTRVRILPITIFAAVLMLSIKVGNIVGVVDQDGKSQTLSVSQAIAQAPPPLPPEDLPPALGDMPPSVPTPDPAPPPPPPAAEGAAMDAVDPANDPTLLSESEINTLQQLAERRATLDARQEELDAREGMLQAAEDRINKKIEEMRILEGTIQKLVKTHDDQQDAKVASLVRIYENMKPKDAARIFEELDLDTLLLVAERMKERKLAPVMAQMNPEKAKEVTVELARLRRLPEAGTEPGG